MAKKRYSSAGTTTPFLKQLILTILLFAILPVTALAAEGAPNSLYVGDKSLSVANDSYWTTDADGKLTQSAADQSWNVKYAPSTATLTLNSATIKGDNSAIGVPFGAGIYALCSNNQPVALTIKLIGTNTITGLYGIFLNAEISASSYGTDASLTITGENNGSLEVSGSSHGIYVKSGTGNASLNIKNVAVTSSTNGNYAAGVYVMSGSSATNSPNISLSVDGGSLTASGTGSSDGIQFYVGDSNAPNATTSLTVTDHAIVDARTGGIRASRISETLPTPTPTDGNSSGIVFDGTEGTVYGDVTLDESLTINEGETLTVPDGSSLNGNGKLTNNGTIIVKKGGNLTGDPGGTVVSAPTIGTQPASQSVTEGNTATFTVAATGEKLSYQWQQSTDNGQNWTDISEAKAATYTTAATTTSMNGYQYRCVVINSAGSVTSSAATLTVQAKPAYTVTAVVAPEGAGSVKVNDSGTSATIAESSEVTLTATANEGYRFTRWTSSNGGTIADASSASTTFTMPAGDVTVTAIFKKIPTASDFTLSSTEFVYNGEKQCPTITSLVAGMGKISTSYWQEDEEVTNPVNAGAYTVKVSVEEGTSYTAATGLTSDDWTFEIKKATPVVEIALPADLIYDGEPKTVTATVTGVEGETETLESTLSYYTDEEMTEEVEDVVGAGTYYVKASFARNDNYEAAEETGSFIIGKANPTPAETPGSYTANVGDQLSGIKLPEGWAWEDDPSTILDEEDSYVFVAIFTPEDTDNYNSIQQVVMITVVWPEPEPEPEPEPTYYRVDLRPVEGATVILSADEVEEGGTLTFTIEIAEGYVADDLMVTVSQGIGKAVEVKPDEAGVYTVKEVDGLVTITVYGVTEEPATAIERVETLRIYAAEGILHVETPTRQRVTIVSMGGALIADGEQEGAQIYRDLNAGVYIVRVGDYATKVRVE